MVYPQSNSWHCFGCKAGGSVIDLVMAMEGIDFIEACNKLRVVAGITDDELIENAPPPPPDPMLQAIRQTYVPSAEGELPTEEYLQSAQQNKHAYLRDRGFGDDVWDYFELGYEPYGYGPKLEMKERIVIPWRDDKGKLITIQGRAVDDTTKPKYKFWKNSYKGNVLYGLWNNLSYIRARKELVVFEGAPKVWRAYQHAMLNCCGIGGNVPTEQQLKLLIKYSQFNLVLWLDNDDAGNKGVKDIIKAVKPLCKVKVIRSEVKPDDIMEKETFWKEYSRAEDC
jgi:DNA primase